MQGHSTASKIQGFRITLQRCLFIVFGGGGSIHPDHARRLWAMPTAQLSFILQPDHSNFCGSSTCLDQPDHHDSSQDMNHQPRQTNQRKNYSPSVKDHSQANKRSSTDSSQHCELHFQDLYANLHYVQIQHSVEKFYLSPIRVTNTSLTVVKADYLSDY